MFYAAFTAQEPNRQFTNLQFACDTFVKFFCHTVNMLFVNKLSGHITCILLCIVLQPVNAQSVTFSSSPQQTLLLELYTSEGCSSCPPADRWISGLKLDPRLWKDIVPLAFHVDYWNYLGWTDRFAKPAYSARQRLYANYRYARSVYTPGFFKNGREWSAWFRNRDLATSQNIAGLLKVEINANTLQASYTPATVTDKTLLLHVAVLGFNIKTQVESGENNGKTLVHNFVVMALHDFRGRLQDGSYQWRIENAPVDLTLHYAANANTNAIAAWVTQLNDPTPIQATGGWIKP